MKTSFILSILCTKRVPESLENPTGSHAHSTRYKNFLVFSRDESALLRMGEPGPSSTRLGLSGLVIAFRLVQKFPSWAGRVRVGSDRTWKTLESGVLG